MGLYVLMDDFELYIEGYIYPHIIKCQIEADSGLRGFVART